jgi:hypothetical protein
MLVKLVVMLLVVLKHHCPCYMLSLVGSLFSFGWSVVGTGGAKPDCTF